MIDNTIYNPASLSKDSLIDNFVVRTKIFEKIFNDLKTGDMKYPEQHYLIQGQRGMGKTTLLLRLKYEIENTNTLKEWLIPVFFNEESYDLTSLSNLWEKLLKYLDELWNTQGKYFNETEKYIGAADYEKKCFDLLTEMLNSKKKKLIIFFDNFGQLFLHQLKTKEKHRLREILMNCNDIRIVGASAIVLKDLHDYSEPFYEFFKIIPLEGLNKDESFDLITKLQEKDHAKIDLQKCKGKIETLAILTGGVIRTLMMVYEVVLADQDGSALKDLETVLDRITPLYKHRIEDLPVQQRKIIDVIAKHWDAISTKDIASYIREDGKPMATKLISAQLQQLEKNNVIEKKQTNTKNHLYQLKERFFNIWYLMRNGDRLDKRKVTWLTKFLELWYDDEKSLNDFINRHVDNLRRGNYHSSSALLLSQALVNSELINVKDLDLLLSETNIILEPQSEYEIPKLNRIKELELIEFYIYQYSYEKAKKFLDKFSFINIETDYNFLVYKAILDPSDESGPSSQQIEILEKINETFIKNKIVNKAYLFLCQILIYNSVTYKKDIIKSLKIIDEVKLTMPGIFLEYYSFIEIWNSNYQKGFNILVKILNRNIEILLDEKLFNNSLILLLSRKQYHSVLKIFQSKEDLKDILKPTYYALMTFLQDEYPNEIIKMGRELEQPVNDILAEIEKMKIDYK